MIIDAQRSRVIEMEPYARYSFSELYEKVEAAEAKAKAAEAEAEAEKAARKAAEAEARAAEAEVEAEKVARKAAEAEVKAAEVRKVEINQLISALWGLPGGDKMLRCASKDDEYRAELMKKYFTGE